MHLNVERGWILFQRVMEFRIIKLCNTTVRFTVGPGSENCLRCSFQNFKVLGKAHQVVTRSAGVYVLMPLMLRLYEQYWQEYPFPGWYGWIFVILFGFTIFISHSAAPSSREIRWIAFVWFCEIQFELMKCLTKKNICLLNLRTKIPKVL